MCVSVVVGAIPNDIQLIENWNHVLSGKQLPFAADNNSKPFRCCLCTFIKPLPCCKFNSRFVFVAKSNFLAFEPAFS
jgi:hypothetical protein